GDGAALVCAADASIAFYPAAYRLGRANGICRAAKALYDADACVAAAQLSPDYHRLSQAQRERAERTLKGDKI
ncbi:MAG: tRNA (adenosine(37)-N6)-threonylcarbamoyltransferase complex dimerization subunit type 1 TsaB, partial [Ruthenibacterium sp.]